jgi:O-antigen/teichoic acid export membrane protein
VRNKLKQLRSVALYFLIPAASAVSPLLVIPALTHAYGAGGWAAVAVAQALGSAAGIIAELGWSVVGPQRVARADAAGLSALYQSAFATKLFAFLALAPLAAVMSYILAPDHKLAAATLGLAASAAALSPSWYLTGCNRPLAILTTETLPRMFFAIVAAAVIYLGAPLELYGLSILSAACLTVFLGSRVTGQPLWPNRAAFASGIDVIKQQLPLTFGRIVSVIYTSLPVALVSSVSPASVANFAAIERLARMFLSLLGGVPSRLQSWVGVAQGEDRISRSRRSLAYNAFLGLGGAVFFAITAPFAVPYVFSRAVSISPTMFALGSILVFLVCTSRGVGLSLVAEGHANFIAAANIGAACVGVISVLSLSKFWGSVGGFTGTLLSEVTGLAIQVFILFMARRWLKARSLD